MEHLPPLRATVRIFRPLFAGLTAGLCLIWVQNAFANPQQGLENADICQQAVEYQERRQHIPRGLLTAISHAESGRWDANEKAIVAWPWTVTTGGKGHFLPNRMDAMAYVESLQADGVENIDVGCLQINLKYHPDAFANLEEAFTPQMNAAYAADFLTQRFSASQSWIQAAGDYHSTTPALHHKYRQKITRLWTQFTHVAGTPTPTNFTVPAPINTTLTQRFNLAFQSRQASGVGSLTGQVLANRHRAMTPSFAQPAQAQENSFSQKRQSQLLAWRQSNGFSVLTQ